jgi:hypothetical protein
MSKPPIVKGPPFKRKSPEVIQHYDPKRYIIVPFESLTDKSLTDGDRRMLTVLCSFLLGKSHLWASRAALAERAGIDESNVSKRVRRLADLGWVTVHRRGQATNLMEVHIPERLKQPQDAAPSTQESVSTEDEDVGEWCDATDYELDSVYASDPDSISDTQIDLFM